MEPEYTTKEVVVEKQPSVWNTVTPFSKYLAMALFVALPFVGGWVGYTFAPEKVVEIEKIVKVENKQSSDDLQQGVNEDKNLQKWDTRDLVNFTATSTGIAFEYPEVWGPIIEVGNEGIYSYYFSGLGSSAYFLSIESVVRTGSHQEGAVSWINRVKDTAEFFVEKCDAIEAEYNFPNEKCSEFTNSEGVDFYDFFGYFFSYGDPGPHESDYTHNFISKYDYGSQEYWMILTPQKIYTENYWNEKVFQSTVVDSLRFIDNQ